MRKSREKRRRRRRKREKEKNVPAHHADTITCREERHTFTSKKVKV